MTEGFDLDKGHGRKVDVAMMKHMIDLGDWDFIGSLSRKLGVRAYSWQHDDHAPAVGARDTALRMYLHLAWMSQSVLRETCKRHADATHNGWSDPTWAYRGNRAFRRQVEARKLCLDAELTHQAQERRHTKWRRLVMSLCPVERLLAVGSACDRAGLTLTATRVQHTMTRVENALLRPRSMMPRCLGVSADVFALSYAPGTDETARLLVDIETEAQAMLVDYRAGRSHYMVTSCRYTSAVAAAAYVLIASRPNDVDHRAKASETIERLVTQGWTACRGEGLLSHSFLAIGQSIAGDSRGSKMGQALIDSLNKVAESVPCKKKQRAMKQFASLVVCEPKPLGQ